MFRRYRRSCRTIVLLLIAANTSGCYVWSAQSVEPAQLITNHKASAFRITRNDGSNVIVQQLSIQGDTLIGVVRGNATSSGEIRIPRNDVREVARERVSGWRTALLVTPVASYVAMYLLVGYACRGGREC